MQKNNGPTGELDPRGLILEAYRIDGIAAADCRSIFFDWALGLDASRNMATDAASLLSFYAEDEPDHQMTTVLRESLEKAAAPRRRGGRRGR